MLIHRGCWINLHRWKPRKMDISSLGMIIIPFGSRWLPSFAIFTNTSSFRLNDQMIFPHFHLFHRYFPRRTPTIGRRPMRRASAFAQGANRSSRATSAFSGLYSSLVCRESFLDTFFWAWKMLIGTKRKATQVMNEMRSFARSPYPPGGWTRSFP